MLPIQHLNPRHPCDAYSFLVSKVEKFEIYAFNAKEALSLERWLRRLLLSERGRADLQCEAVFLKSTPKKLYCTQPDLLPPPSAVPCSKMFNVG